MATKLTAEQIRTLNGITDEQKESLLSILTEVETANAEVTRLRKSQPTESQRVVESADYTKLESAIAERDRKISELEKIAAALQVPPDTFNGPFDAIFALFK